MLQLRPPFLTQQLTLELRAEAGALCAAANAEAGAAAMHTTPCRKVGAKGLRAPRHKEADAAALREYALTTALVVAKALRAPPHEVPGTKVLDAIIVVAALIVTALFPGIFATYEQPKDMMFGQLGFGELSVKSDLRMRMYMRAGCAAAVAFASGAIIIAVALQIAILSRAFTLTVTAHHINLASMMSLYFLLCSRPAGGGGIKCFSFCWIPGELCLGSNGRPCCTFPLCSSRNMRHPHYEEFVEIV